MNWRPGIRTEIVFTLAVLMAGTVALAGVVFLKVEERVLLQQKVKAGRQMIAALKELLEEEGIQGEQTRGRFDPLAAQRLLLLLAGSLPSSHFAIIGPDFTVVADSRPGRVGTPLRDNALEKAITTGTMLVHQGSEGASFSLLKTSPLLFSAPFPFPGGARGSIRAELALDDLRQSHSRAQAAVFRYILLNALLLIALGGYLLSRIIVRPLQKLVAMADKIAEGNLQFLDERAGKDEMGKLFSSFRHMAAKLREDRAKADEYIRSLEDTNLRLKRAQDEVLRSEKLASIGRLAAGVAHEVGNPAAAILGYLDLLSGESLTAAEEREVLACARREAERIRRILRELLDFSRPSRGEGEDVDVNSVIADTLSLLAHQKKVWQQFEVVTCFDPGLPVWRGDAHQLRQVMLNLFLNAQDALTSAPGNPKKKIRVATRAVGPEERTELGEMVSRAREQGREEGIPGKAAGSPPLFKEEPRSSIWVEVEDTGPGIPPEALGRIFDPFYSTKPPGEGTGLGLAVCLRVLESYGGRISVQSTIGQGTTFSVFLPISPQRHRGHGED